MHSVLRTALSVVVLILSSLLFSSCSASAPALSAFSSSEASAHALTASPATVNFGNQTVNSTAGESVAITNSGKAAVVVQNVSLSGSAAFQVLGFTGAITLSPSETFTLNINFTPAASAAYAGMLEVSVGGGAGIAIALSGAGTGAAAPTPVTVTISPASAWLPASGTQQFTATVTGSSNSAVDWMVNGVLGGSSALGTISVAGFYTAPASAPAGETVTVTAQSAGDSTKSASAAVTLATVYANINESTTLDTGSGTGWGWCGTPSCAGGKATATQQLSWGQQPSLDGGSVQFMTSGTAWADALWWYKVGRNDAATHFQTDFWLNVSQAATSYAQALEFDTFQFVSPQEYMFGTQCDYGQGYSKGIWDVWNGSTGHWTSTGLACPDFAPGDWYHITWSFDRTSDQYEHYNSVIVQQYDSTGNNLLATINTPVNMALPSGPLPSGWSDNLGLNFQLDINGAPGASTASFTTLVDKISLTVW
jgi:Abnormal spindle-like microcephaly-assoc'd, ASPM-SPD-2-Hydin